MKDLPLVSIDSIRRKNKVVHSDTEGNGRAIQEAKELAKSYLRKKIPFVWNATNITRQMREPLIAMFADYGFCVKIIYVEVPYQKLHSQNQHREYNIPRAAVERMIEKLEVPKAWEANEVVYVV